MDNRVTLEDILVIENILNENPLLTKSQMFDDNTGMPLSLSLNGIIINKRKFVIYYKEDRWHVVKGRDEDVCLNINLANFAIAKGWHVEIDDFHTFTEFDMTLRQPEVRIFDRENNLCRSFNFAYMDIVQGAYGNFIIPTGPLVETVQTLDPMERLANCFRYASGRFYETREENDSMIVMNNLNESVITTSGKIYIDADGIRFQDAYSDKTDEIASTAQMIELYGNGAVRKIWDYINTPPISPIESLVKEQMKKILAEGDED